METFAESGFQCPVFKNPTDYYMSIASNPDNHEKLLEEQDKRTRELAGAAEKEASTLSSDVVREVCASTTCAQRAVCHVR